MRTASDGSLFVSEKKSVQALRVDGTLEHVAKLDEPGVVAATARGMVVVSRDQALWSCEPPEQDDARVLWPAGEKECPRRIDASADGRWLALVSEPGEAAARVRVVDVVERRLHCAMELVGASGAALSADGSQLATTNANGAVRLWDLNSSPPRQLVELRGHDGIVWDAIFHPDGKQLITCGSDGTVRFWPINLDDFEVLAETRTVRDWTEDEKVRYRALLGR